MISCVHRSCADFDRGTGRALSCTAVFSHADSGLSIRKCRERAWKDGLFSQKISLFPSPRLSPVISKPVKYREDFKNGPAGWWGWESNHEGLRALERAKSAIVSRSPWWVDYNHAPPGAGYLHMVACLNTQGPFGDAMVDVAGRNAFVDGGFPTDFTNAKMTVRLKGELEARGAHMILLAQGRVGSMTSGWYLHGQPFKITRDWSEQTIHLRPKPSQWGCLGARHNRRDYYGKIDLPKILANVNCNIMLILFPLHVEPMGPIRGDRDRLRAGRDYPVWRSKLPEGYIVLDRVEIDFPSSARSPAGAGPAAK